MANKREKTIFTNCRKCRPHTITQLPVESWYEYIYNHTSICNNGQDDSYGSPFRIKR